MTRISPNTLCKRWNTAANSLTRWVRYCGVVSNTFQCEWLAQGSVVSGRKLVVQREKHCLVLNWFVVFDLSCGHNLHNVLTECIISDHRAVAVSIQCSHLPEFDDEVMEPQPSRIDWLKVTAQEREDYYPKSKNLLDQPQRLGTAKTYVLMRNIWKK